MTRSKHTAARKTRERNQRLKAKAQNKTAQPKPVQEGETATEDSEQSNTAAQPQVKTSKKRNAKSKKAKAETTSGPLTKSEIMKRQKEAAKNRLLRAKMKNENAAILKMPQEVYSNIFSRLPTGDQYRSMQTCSGLYIGVQATMYEELELVYSAAGVRPTAGQLYPKDAVDDKNLSNKKKRKKIRLDPKASKLFQCFRM